MNKKEELRVMVRNLNPTPAARLAMVIWGQEYSQQRGGAMEFWDSLSEDRRKRCNHAVIEITAVLAEALKGIQELAKEEIRLGADDNSLIYEIEARANRALGYPNLE